MKLSDAQQLIAKRNKAGYYVAFEKVDGNHLAADWIPEIHREEALESKVAAWRLAEDFAKVNPRVYVNIYVVDRRYERLPEDMGRTLNPYPAPQLS